MADQMSSAVPAPSAILPTYARADVAFARGEGCWLEATDGSRYLDFGAGIAVCCLGHGHPHLVEALIDQGRKLWHVSNLFRIPQAEELARRLVEASFADYVFFTNSGAEALEGAIKTARKYHAAGGHPEKFRLITFEGAFHGRDTTGHRSRFQPIGIIEVQDRRLSPCMRGSQTEGVRRISFDFSGATFVRLHQNAKHRMPFCESSGVIDRLAGNDALGRLRIGSEHFFGFAEGSAGGQSRHGGSGGGDLQKLASTGISGHLGGTGFFAVEFQAILDQNFTVLGAFPKAQVGMTAHRGGGLGTLGVQR